jgi:antitoxin component YwqK of YwqJK toxin-antitoxin module
MELPVLLKKREPNWRPVIQNSYNSGIPKTILFYEPEKGGANEIPVKIIENYPQGKIHVETDLLFENGVLIPDGASATYTDEGVLHIYATYKNGNLDGKILIFNPNGQLKTSYKVEKGVLEGVKDSFYDNGTLEEKAHYASGKLHGVVEKYYENGNKAALIQYENGILDGEVTEWNPDETLKEKLFYIAGVQYNSQKLPIYNSNLSLLAPLPEETIPSDQNLTLNSDVPQILNGEVLINHPDGTISKKIFYREGKPHGEQISYHLNGKQEALLTYSDGILNGKKTLFDSQGLLLEEAYYKNGDLEGRYFLRRPNGQEVISHYRNNRLYGLYQVFHPSDPTFGKVKAFEANYINGLVEGEASEYNEAGTKITSTFYKNGKKEGIATIYYKDGKVRIAANFIHDLQEGTTSEYYPSGNLAKEATFKNGFRDGEEKTYHENGQLKTFYIIKKDKLNGSGKEWNSQGVLIFEANYIDGKKDGLFKKYDEKGTLISQKIYQNDVLTEKQ